MLELNKNNILNAPLVAVIDYGIGNIYSVQRACIKVGINAVLTSDKNVIDAADAIILPGVGAFSVAMDNLRNSNVIDSIYKAVDSNKFIMGVCLGMQLLMDESEEFGTHKGLGIIPGRCIKFNGKNMKTPQIMWNKIYPPNMDKFNNSSPLFDISVNEYMYFVHSYYVEPENGSNILAVTKYNDFEYCSSIISNNVFGFQFHPEKSGIEGLNIYKNFKKLISND